MESLTNILQVIEGQRHIKGIQGVILDTASFTLMIQSIATIHDDGENVMPIISTSPLSSGFLKPLFILSY